MTQISSRRSHTSRRSFGNSARRAQTGGGHKRGPRKQYIHHSKFIKPARPVASAATYVPMHTFADFAVAARIKKNLATRGFTTPSPIQDQAIPVALTGRDVIGIANTGTGKTMAFAIPIINRLIQEPTARVLMIAPTRELAQQIMDEIRTLIQGVPHVPTALLIGGAAMGPQIRSLKRMPRLVVGTPGRIKDHMERNTLMLKTFNIIVLDEVDRMLDMGFVGDMRTILGACATRRQSYFFSATMDARVRGLIDDFGNRPKVISVRTSDTSDNVEQNVIFHGEREDKLEKLHSVLADKGTGKTIIFEETKRGADRLSKTLNARGFRSDAIHGNKSQNQRQRALSKFKRNATDILVATDVAARGIDVPDVTHVINYTTPQSYQDYTHRIGRAGRAGKTGQALTFVHESERDKQRRTGEQGVSRRDYRTRQRQSQRRTARTHAIRDVRTSRRHADR